MGLLKSAKMQISASIKKKRHVKREIKLKRKIGFLSNRTETN